MRITAGVWMLIFGLLTLWTAVTAWGTQSLFALPDILVRILAAALCIGFGAKSLTSPDVPGANPMSHYARAWNDMWHQKWLLGIAASIGLLSGINRALESFTDKYYMPKLMFERMMSHGTFHIEGFLATLPAQLPGTIQSSLRVFFATVGLAGPVLIPLAILFLLPLFSRMLRNLATEPQYTAKAHFVSRLLIPAGIAAILSATGQTYLRRMMFESMNVPSHNPDSHGIMVILIYFISPVTTVLYSGFISPLIIGGIAGSLSRVRKGIRITAESYVEDTVVQFQPLAGLYILMGFAIIVCQLPLMIFHSGGVGPISIFQFTIMLMSIVYVLIMFAPYESLLGKSIRQSITGSIDMLISHKSEVGNFIAIGMSFLAPIFLISQMLYTVTQGMPSLQMVVSTANAIFTTFICIFVAVAVWDFHWTARNTSFVEKAENQM